MVQHVEMIIDYVVDGDDFQYNDNRGSLTRCKDCDYLYGRYCREPSHGSTFVHGDDFCSKAVKKKP